MVSDSASIRKLKLSNFKLNSLLEITLAINENFSTTKLFEKYEKILSQDLNVGKIYVLIKKDRWESVLRTGIPADYNPNPHELIEQYLHSFQEITSVAIHDSFPFHIFDVIIPVYHKNTPIAYVLIGDIDEDRQGLSPIIKHLTFIQTITNIIVVAIENKRLYKDALDKEAMKRELKVASEMQAMLIPSNESLPKNKYLYASVLYKPYSEVGGDYYDFLHLNEHEFGFCIADVSGKGVSAAILMANFQANLRVLFKRNTSLTQLVIELNHLVNESVEGEKFITFFVAKYNAATRELHYVNAAHNPPILYTPRTNSYLYLTHGSVGLGMFEESPKITQGSIIIPPHSKLLCYTDGLVEAENSQQQEFNTTPIEQALAASADIENAIELVYSNLCKFLGSSFPHDDVSIMGVEFF